MGRIPDLRRLFRLASRDSKLIDRDLDDELDFHLERRAQELLRDGMSREAAKKLAATVAACLIG